ncbi:MAG TPA: hypothetical protein VK165_11050 [Azonexus sp.]|nr:hypothetical protein [Azonexus sp.]
MFDDLYDLMQRYGDYGTGQGITYTPDTPAFQPSDYQSLSGGDVPADTSYLNRRAIDWNSPSALGKASPSDDGYTGSGVQFNTRPEETLYQPQADIQAQSIQNLARGGSNIPTQLGSNTPDKTSAGLNYSGLAKAGLLGAAMYAAGQGGRQQQMPQRLSAPMGGEGWGSTYHPVSFQGAGPFGNASPYTNPNLQKSRNTREELIRRMQYQKGLLG